ncbi:MAG: hypothetical protein GY832_11275 [Chloroflexi bacterium]|nr:hypothetical protein [Chloroflexota bacterium]
MQFTRTVEEVFRSAKTFANFSGNRSIEAEVTVVDGSVRQIKLGYSTTTTYNAMPLNTIRQLRAMHFAIGEILAELEQREIIAPLKEKGNNDHHDDPGHNQDRA